MHEKHIQALGEMLAQSRSWLPAEVDEAALKAAIDLMRAAEPKDAAAEREHCTRVTREILTPRMADDGSPTPTEQVQRERAAARAEGAAGEFAVCDERVDAVRGEMMAEISCLRARAQSAEALVMLDSINPVADAEQAALAKVIDQLTRERGEYRTRVEFLEPRFEKLYQAAVKAHLHYWHGTEVESDLPRALAELGLIIEASK